MANPEHVEIAKQGREAIRKWREIHPGLVLDLREANLSKANLSKADLSKANLSEANLRETKLSEANLRDVDLSWADLPEAKLINADLRGANLRQAKLCGADFSQANLRDADLSGADLRKAILRRANLRDANLSAARLRGADLSGAKRRVTRGYSWPLCIAGGVVVFWFLGGLPFILFSGNVGGLFGDSFGAVNALFSGLAFGGVIYAIILQSMELQLQREELEQTRKELSRQADAQEKTNQHMALSAFLNAQSALSTTYADTRKSESDLFRPSSTYFHESIIKLEWMARRLAFLTEKSPDSFALPPRVDMVREKTGYLAKYLEWETQRHIDNNKLDDAVKATSACITEQLRPMARMLTNKDKDEYILKSDINEIVKFGDTKNDSVCKDAKATRQFVDGTLELIRSLSKK